MAEIKRTFEGGKMNRDLDDRLLPPGQYRDALNAGIGRSEGSDVGAVENLRGNTEIIGQTDINGTTIGQFVDRDSDTIYWFTSNETTDAIHEYNVADGVRTLITEPKARVAPLPTCTPELQARQTEPDGGSFGTRLDLPPLPAAPVGGCTDPTATNFDRNAAFDDGSCTFLSAFSVSISGNNSPYAHDATATLTAVPTGAGGTVTYSWTGPGITTPLTTASIDVVAANAGVFTVVATDTVTTPALVRNATATTDVSFGAAPVPTAPVAIISAPVFGGQAGVSTLSVDGLRSTAGDDGAGTNYTIATYAWSVPTGSPLVISDATAASITVTSAMEGTFSLELIVTNSNGDVSIPAISMFTFTAAPDPIPPTAVITDVGPASAIIGNPITLSGMDSAGGSNGISTNYTVASYAWTLPTGVTATAGTTSQEVTFTSQVIGMHDIMLVVTNSNGDVSAPATRTVDFTRLAPVPTTLTLETDASAVAISVGPSFAPTFSITAPDPQNFENLDSAEIMVPVNYTASITLNSGFEFSPDPPVGLTATLTAVPPAAATGLTLNHTVGELTATVTGMTNQMGTVTVTWTGATTQEETYTHVRRNIFPNGVVAQSHALTGVTSAFRDNDSTLTSMLPATTSVAWTSTLQIERNDMWSGSHPTLTVTNDPNATGDLLSVQTNITSNAVSGVPSWPADTVNELWSYNQRGIQTGDTNATSTWGGSLVPRTMIDPHILPGSFGWSITPGAAGNRSLPHAMNLVVGSTAEFMIVDPNNIGWANLRNQLGSPFGWVFSFSQTSGTGTTPVVMTVDAVGTYVGSQSSLNTGYSIDFTRIADTDGGTATVRSTSGTYIHTF